MIMIIVIMLMNMAMNMFDVWSARLGHSRPHSLPAGGGSFHYIVHCMLAAHPFEMIVMV